MDRKNHCLICGKELNDVELENSFHIHTPCKYGSKFDGDDINFRMCTTCGDYYIELFQAIGHYNPVIDKSEFNIITGEKL